MAVCVRGCPGSLALTHYHREAVGTHTLGPQEIPWLGNLGSLVLSKPRSPETVVPSPSLGMATLLSHRPSPATRPLHCTAPGSTTHSCESCAMQWPCRQWPRFPLLFLLGRRELSAKEGRKGFTPASWLGRWLSLGGNHRAQRELWPVRLPDRDVQDLLSYYSASTPKLDY